MLKYSLISSLLHFIAYFSKHLIKNESLLLRSFRSFVANVTNPVISTRFHQDLVRFTTLYYVSKNNCHPGFPRFHYVSPRFVRYYYVSLRISYVSLRFTTFRYVSLFIYYVLVRSTRFISRFVRFHYVSLETGSKREV